jgi:hypothetical protein
MTNDPASRESDHGEIIPLSIAEEPGIFIPAAVLGEHADRIPLQAGEGDWIRQVAVCDESEIVVKNNDSWLFLLGIGGIIALVAAIAAGAWFLPALGDPQVPRIKKIQAVGGVTALLVIGVVGMTMLARIGRRVVLGNGEVREKKRHQMLSSIACTAGARVILLYGEPDKDGDQILHVSVAGADETGIGMAATLTAQPAASAYARLAARSAALLRLPLEIRGELTKGHDALKAWHERLTALAGGGVWQDPALNPEGDAPTYKPIVAIPGWTYGVIGLVLLSVVAGFFLVSWMKWLFWIGAQIVGLLLLFSGLNAVRSRRAEGKLGEQYEGNKAVLVGYGQVLAGLIALVALPVVLILAPEPGAKNLRPQRWGAQPAIDTSHTG